MKNEFLQELYDAEIWSGITISEGGGGISIKMVLGNSRLAAEEIQKQNPHVKLTDIMDGMEWLKKNGLNICFGDKLTLVSSKLKEERKKEIAKIPQEIKEMVGNTFIRSFEHGKAEIFIVEDIHIDETVQRVGIARPRQKREVMTLQQKLVLTWKKISWRNNGVEVSEPIPATKKYSHFINDNYVPNGTYKKLFS